MPGLGIKRVLQATPVGYLTEMEDGSQVTFPEHVMVQAGYVPPTPGAYEGPGFAQTPLEAPQVPEPQLSPMAPEQTQPQPQVPAAPPPASQSVGMSQSTSTPRFVQRPGQMPPSLDLGQERADLDQAGAQIDKSYADQHSALDAQAQAEGQRNAVLNGTFDEQGNLVKPGMAQEVKGQREDDLEEMQHHDQIVNDYVAKEQNRISQNIAAIPQEDPGKIWHDNAWWQNAAGLMSAYYGGMLAVSTGSGKNLGLEALEHAIDRSIESQRANIESEFKRVAHDKDTLQQYQAWKGQQRAWKTEQQIYRLETLKLDRLAQAETFSSAAKQAELRGQAAALEAMQGEKAAELTKLKGDFASAETRSAFDRVKLGSELANDRAERSLRYAQTEQTKAQTEAAKVPKGPLVLSDRTGMTVDPSSPFQVQAKGPDGKSTVALYTPRSTEEKDKLDSLGTVALNQHTILSSMREFLRTDPSSWSPEDRLRFANLSSQYIMSGGEKLGRMTDRDAELLKTQAGGEPLKFAQALTTLGASIESIEDTMEANRSRYEVGAQQINRDIRVRMPDPDPVVVQRYGPQDPRGQDHVGNASATVQKAFKDTGSRAEIRRLDAVDALEQTVVAEGTNAGPLELKKVEAAIAALKKLPASQRSVPGLKGENQDALVRLQALRQYVLNMQAAGGFTGSFDQSQTLSGDGVNVLDGVNPKR